MKLKKYAKAFLQIAAVSALIVVGATGSAYASCSTSDIAHDRTKGPWVIRAPAYPVSAADSVRFEKLNDYLIRYLHNYLNFRRALNDGYASEAFMQYHSKRAPSGSLVLFTRRIDLNVQPDLGRPPNLFYRQVGGRLQLIGGQYYFLAHQESDIDALLPTALAHWHRVQYACTAPPGSIFYASFLIRGKMLDWGWPGLDKFDVDPAAQAWPWTHR